MDRRTRPQQQGLYDPQYEHDACGVGFVAHIKGEKSHDILEHAREILVNMTHRGAVGSDKNSGDGAGILTALPHRFLETVIKRDLGRELPPRGTYSAGLVFLSREADERDACRRKFEEIAARFSVTVLGWRDVPRDNSMIGPTAVASEPVIQQVFVAAAEPMEELAFERKLYLTRKSARREIRGTQHDPNNFFYVCSLSTRVIVYKGMLMPEQLFAYFPDLSEPEYRSHLAMVHSRFSTNTFPSWDRAQPLRFMSHNGEINTLRGNINKMRAREGMLASPLFGDQLPELFPIIEPDASDSGNFDNVLELLLMAGRELPEAVMMMVPEAWRLHRHMPDIGKAVYEYMSCMMEPWDGPASISFTDGRVIGALLDRNGLRPSRYYVTTDDLVVMASEVGVLDIPPEKVRLKGRLQPGRMFLVDFEQGRIVDDLELKNGIAGKRPYRQWLKEQKITLSDLPAPGDVAGLDDKTVLNRLRMFGYSVEHLNIILKPMAENGKEPLGSMGNDTPLAVLSEKPRLLYDYFKQLFAQVTNPPIDSIREDIIMDMSSYIGPEQNLLDTTPEHAHRLQLQHPVLTNAELAQLKKMNHRGWSSTVIDITYPVSEGTGGLKATLSRISTEAEQAIAEGYPLVILSDRAAGPDRMAVSALAATGAVHHHLVRKAKRTQIGIVVESAEPREVHHFCTLVGYGADAINPYLAYEAMWKLKHDGVIDAELSEDEIVERYHNALTYGMRKVFGKMGISTLESYKGAQIFEIVGLSSEVVDTCFAGTASRIEGAGFDILAREDQMRHKLAYPGPNEPIGSEYYNPGDYQWRFDGETHMWDPQSIADLQAAVRYNDPAAFKRFSNRQNRRSRDQATIRGLLKFKPGNRIPLDQVEPAENIMRRFATGAMSFGSISQEAHETLAVAMNRLGGKSNTGEGGEMRERYQPLANGDSKRSAIKQIASGRFGVTIEYLANADELQIKMAQGAKPGEGGELPGHKVFDVIAKTRYSTPGVGLISPPPHHDIYSIEDLAQLIFDLKNANPGARISVKLVSEVGVGTVAAGVAKAHADHILISGQDGGTGASPLTGIKHAGLPWELGLSETHQTLVMNDLRSRVVVQTDGQLKTGRDVIVAALLGAQECGFSTGPLIAVGCIMMRVCHKNTCPVGVATQDERLRKKFAGRPEDVMAYFRFVAEEVREQMAELGFRTFDEMVGRVDMLEVDEDAKPWKAQGVDLTRVITPAAAPAGSLGAICCVPQDHGIEDILDLKLIEACEHAIENREPVSLEMAIRNTDRTTGTMLSHQIAKRWGIDGLPDETISVKFTGSAGQSFGAWAAKGITLELEGDANDYVGKGLSGGKLIIYPPRDAGLVPEENIIIGNVALYGAVGGKGFFRGMAAERFCVRNSGAHVVIEGVGDHGCEYMTGGRAVILGPTGRNFAAGMSGGIAWVWDREGRFAELVNPGMVELTAVEDEDESTILDLIREHAILTGSTVAQYVLETWRDRRAEFVRVISPAYRRILEIQQVRDKEVVHG
ncbi:MAG: glutamate synthase large subunit [Spirochaetaceae bacterium]|nr:MAG: glutamate synthase large subunit [Spirochaetaceae bacterium]